MANQAVTSRFLMATSQESTLASRVARLESIASDESRLAKAMSVQPEELAELVEGRLFGQRKRRRRRHIPPAARQLLNELSDETGNSPEVILLTAPGLYKIGLEALREGNRLAVVDPDWEPIQEITGISVIKTAGKPTGAAAGE